MFWPFWPSLKACTQKSQFRECWYSVVIIHHFCLSPASLEKALRLGYHFYIASILNVSCPHGSVSGTRQIHLFKIPLGDIGMKNSVADHAVIHEPCCTLCRLDVFDPTELIHFSESQGTPIASSTTSYIAIATQLLKEARLQLEKENLPLLEYAVHKLRGIFTTIGCHRLAFLFEKMEKNLTRVKLDYLRDLFGDVTDEFKSAQRAINDYIKTNLTNSRWNAVI